MQLRKWDPTNNWTSAATVDIVVDLDARTLGGVHLGEPLERLSALGRPDVAYPVYSADRKRIVGGTWHYPALGLSFGGHWRVEEWSLDMVPTAGSRRFLLQGQPVSVDEGTTEADVTGWLGTPYWRGHSDQVDDSGEFDLFYEVGGLEWMFEMTAAGTLKSVSLQEPVLASEEGRRMYGVTQVWPPS